MRRFVLLLLAAAAVAQTPHFLYERPLTPAGSGPNSIAPDVTLMSHAASDLRDLRLFDATGKEVPYLLIPPAEPAPKWQPGTILPVAPVNTKTEATSGFEVDLHVAPRIDRLRLTGMPTPFLKRLRLEGSGDRSHWTLLAAEGTLFDLPDEDLHMTEIGFLAGEYRYLRVTWDDRASGVVPQPRAVAARLVQLGAPPAPLKAPVEFRKLSSSPGHSRFQVVLPGPHLPLAALELTVQEDRLLRTARVTEGRLADGMVNPQVLGQSMLRRVVRGGLIAADLRIPIRTPEGREIEIVVDDDNNPPLNLTQVSLEFGPLPWIYLESRGGDPLTARFGDPRMSAARYDLEAMRKYAGSADTKGARWGEIKSAPLEDGFKVVLPPLTGAPIDRKQFAYQRAIPASPPGLTALLLDVAVLAHCQLSLADLRIADATDHQIPYLLETSEDVLGFDVPLAKLAATNTSNYSLTLPYTKLPPATLLLTTSERVFQRTISLHVQRKPAPGAHAKTETIATTIWRRADPDTPTPPLKFTVPSEDATTLLIAVDEGDNSPLPLTKARLELPLYRLRFFNPPSSSLTLLYGQKDLSPPRYDLELLAPRLVGVSSRELAFSQGGIQESAAPSASKTPLETWLFWGALIGAVVVLFGLLARLLRTKPV